MDIVVTSNSLGVNKNEKKNANMLATLQTLNCILHIDKFWCFWLGLSHLTDGDSNNSVDISKA